MRFNEILVEDKQLDELNIGRGIGKAVGGVAKGIGAVAGGIAGIPGAIKKGFQAGKKTVAGDDEPAKPAGGSAAPAAEPAEKPTVGGALKTAAGSFKAGFDKMQGDVAAAKKGGRVEPTLDEPKGTTAKPAAKTAAQPAAEPTAQEPAAQEPDTSTPQPQAAGAAEPEAQPEEPKPAAGKTSAAVAGLRDRISKLAPEDQKAMITSLKKMIPAQAAPGAKKPVAKPGSPGAAAFGKMVQDLTKKPDDGKPAASKGPQGGDHPNLGFGFDGNTGMPFKSQAERDAGLAKQKANKAAPAETPAATPDAAPSLGRKQGGGKVAGQLSQTPGAIKKRQQREIKRRTTHPADDNPNIQLGSESKIYSKFSLNENFSLFRKVK